MKFIKRWVLPYLNLILFISSISLILSGHWILGLLLIIVLITYRIYNGWNLIVLARDHVEYSLYGRPLEKEYWTKSTWENRPRLKMPSFEWIPSSISTNIHWPFRFALFLCAFSFCYFAIGYLFDYPKINYFASIFYVCAVFLVTFILLQVLAAVRILYERKSKRQSIRTTKSRKVKTTSKSIKSQ